MWFAISGSVHIARDCGVILARLNFVDHSATSYFNSLFLFLLLPFPSLLLLPRKKNIQKQEHYPICKKMIYLLTVSQVLGPNIPKTELSQNTTEHCLSKWLCFSLHTVAMWFSLKPIGWECWGPESCRFGSWLSWLFPKSLSRPTKQGGIQCFFSSSTILGIITIPAPSVRLGLLLEAPKERRDMVIFSFISSSLTQACQLWVPDCQIEQNLRPWLDTAI